MNGKDLERANEIRDRIRASHISVFDDTADADSPFYYASSEVEALLKSRLIGNQGLSQLENKSRGKFAKQLVAEALGYEAPASFKRVRPRLLHPGLDVAVQGSRNFQPVNEDIDASRRYVFVILDGDKYISDVRVVLGSDLASWDTTGKLTRKYQASRRSGTGSKLVSKKDTDRLTDLMRPSVGSRPASQLPTSAPIEGAVLPISELYSRLLPLVGKFFPFTGVNQERTRGDLIHNQVSVALGFFTAADSGQFPDVLAELLEVKLQLSPTVDLGMELPSSDDPLATTNFRLRAKDIRYAIFHGSKVKGGFEIDSLVVTTGQDFFSEYRKFEGQGLNSKLQVPLPKDWFS